MKVVVGHGLALLISEAEAEGVPADHRLHEHGGNLDGEPVPRLRAKVRIPNEGVAAGEGDIEEVAPWPSPIILRPDGAEEGAATGDL